MVSYCLFWIHICFGRCFCTCKKGACCRALFGILPYLSSLEVFSPPSRPFPASPLRSRRLHLGLHSQAPLIQSQRHFLLHLHGDLANLPHLVLLLFMAALGAWSNVESIVRFAKRLTSFVPLLFPPSFIYSSQTSCLVLPSGGLIISPNFPAANFRSSKNHLPEKVAFRNTINGTHHTIGTTSFFLLFHPVCGCGL